MAGVLDTVNQRTQLVGENRLELLMFRLNGPQLYAINVFKVQEVQQLPKLTLLPLSNPMVVGITHVRGQTITVIDLALAIGMPSIQNRETANIIITEYNMTTQAFMVGGVERIVNMNWEEIASPPVGSGNDHYLTAITNVSNKIVEIIDVEKILAQIRTYDANISQEILDKDEFSLARGRTVLLVDDSKVALNLETTAMKQMGIEVVTANNGAEGLMRLKAWVESGFDFENEFLMMITDAEMPLMDGYRLTTECREHPVLKDIYIVLHTSLSGTFNLNMVEKVGCNAFASKFQPDSMAHLVLERVKLYPEYVEQSDSSGSD